MLAPETFLRHMLAQGVRFFSGVPDSLLKEVCACLAATPEGRHVIAADEGGAVALGLGYHLATGGVPLVYFQNSGLGHAMNPILSLAAREVYGVPVLLLIGWRGEPGVKDEPQHVKQGATTPAILEAMGVPYRVLDATLDDAGDLIAAAMAAARAERAPYAFLVRKGTFSKARATSSGRAESALTREAAIALVAGALGSEHLVVATTGMASRELFELREAAGQGHGSDFLTVGGMGHASQIALGLAMHRPDRKVVCLDGDGAVLMHMGALAINAASGASNFKHIVLNNAAHDSVGGQPTVAGSLDLPGAARALGYRFAAAAGSADAVQAALPGFLAADGPALLEIAVARGHRPDLGRPTSSPAENLRQFMEHLGSIQELGA